MPHSDAHRPRSLSSLDPEELRALRDRHDPHRRLVVDAIGEWRIAVVPQDSPRWAEERARGTLDLMVWNPVIQASIVTPSRATDDQAEVRIGHWVGRFCGVACACRWLIETHNVTVPHPDAVHRAWTHLVLAHTLLVPRQRPS